MVVSAANRGCDGMVSFVYVSVYLVFVFALNLYLVVLIICLNVLVFWYIIVQSVKICF